jgi:hypothetical protein
MENHFIFGGDLWLLHEKTGVYLVRILFLVNILESINFTAFQIGPSSSFGMFQFLFSAKRKWWHISSKFINKKLDKQSQIFPN